MDITIEKLTNKNSPYFETVCEWQCGWWGFEYERKQVFDFMERCLNEDKVPQTYIAIKDDVVVGNYCILMGDDISVRPNYYPWLANVYVDPDFRGQGICNVLMEDAVKRFKELGVKRAYLHTRHHDLYEKYGWTLLEEVETFAKKIKRIYYIDIT